MVTSLPAPRAEELRAAAFTYTAVGATAQPRQPSGLRRVERTWSLPDADFGRAGEHLMTWRMHENAGLRVAASSPRAAPGAVVLMRLGVGRWGLPIPCRVVYVVEETDRTGFAYGTLPGHPVAGEELFLVERDAAGRVSFTVRALSRPASRLMRLGGRAALVAQDTFMRRYPRALTRS
jgi:uncharacterized protein (UPF0548 family)